MMKLSIEERMRRVRSKNGKAELIVFSFLRRNEIYFQKHYKRAIGPPDVALPRKKRALFIDGDFWHGRTIEKTIESRGPNDFWSIKVMNNIERDKRQRKQLEREDWSILRIWESDINRKSTREIELEKIRRFLEQ